MRPLLFLAICALSSSNIFSALQPFAVSTNGMHDLSATLESHLERTKFPAIAAAVIEGKNIIAAGVAGVRKAGETNLATLGDKFHIGSCTKSITALLATLLIQDGTIALTSRVGEVLREWDIPEHAGDITLDQLLHNRSGLGNKPDPDLWSRAFEASGLPREQRREFLTEFLNSEPEAEPGSTYIYSNIGYSLAGAMMETAARMPWEDLVRKKIFEPLRLTSAGFGPPSSFSPHPSSFPHQPSGHSWRDDEAQPRRPHDNPAAIAPGGAVHMSILDTARYAAFHLAVARGEVNSLKSFRDTLYTPPEETDYALGWVVAKRHWAGGKVLTHSGSNTMFFTVIWIAPEKDMAFIVSTNVGDRDDYVFNQCDKIVAELIGQFAK